MINKVNQINQLTSVQKLKLEHQNGQTAGNGFEAMLRDKLETSSGVQFSKHATQRVQQRGIEVTDTLLDGINQAVEKARSKGAKDVAIISSRGAFIVNVPNNTVVTSMSESEMRENIFTNIDSAVLL